MLLGLESNFLLIAKYGGLYYVENTESRHPRGKNRAIGHVDLSEGSKVLLTLLRDEQAEFWLGAS
jgi:hypothetical protein